MLQMFGYVEPRKDGMGVSWTELSVFPHWKEKVKAPSWISSAPSSPPKTIKMLSGSQPQAERGQMKVSSGCCLLMLAAGLAEAAPGQSPAREVQVQGCWGSKVNPPSVRTKERAVLGWWIQDSSCRLYQLFNWNFELSKKMVNVVPLFWH